MNYYISAEGNDKWSGRLDTPNADGTDGPFRTLAGAQYALRNQKPASQETTTIYLRGGRHNVAEPLVWTAEDVSPVRFASYPGETAAISGGVRLTGWQEEEVNGIPVWTTLVPEAACGEWNFRQLFVNGRRRERTRYPKNTMLTIDSVPGQALDDDGLIGTLFDGSAQFVYRAGDLRRWSRLEDAEIVVLHYWIEERMPILWLDEQTRTVTSTRRSVFKLRDDVRPAWADYYVENLFEALTDPGEWYLDRPAGKLYYIPLPGEEMANLEAIAPRPEQLFRVAGTAEQPVRHIELLNLVFEHGDWSQPPGGDPENIAETEGMDRLELANSPQAAYHLDGAVSFEYARDCKVTGCTVARVGQHGIQIGQGCSEMRLSGNRICDTGAGGITISGASSAQPVAGITRSIIVEDNHIHHGGRVFLCAPGILIRYAVAVQTVHNHIHDYYYTGISCGWVWGYKDHISRDNLIAYNRIHDIGFGVLNDMGGIYTLGVQPGTVLRGNAIYRISMKNYGGWGIYLDEGSSHILVEGNYVFDTATECFNVNQGRGNIVRHNVFIGGGGEVVRLNRIRSEHKAFTAYSNIIVARQAPAFSIGFATDEIRDDCGFDSDKNIIWRTDGQAPEFEQWKRCGNELFSCCADPLIEFDEQGYTLSATSPAFSVGFRPFDVSIAGIRSHKQDHVK